MLKKNSATKLCGNACGLEYADEIQIFLVGQFQNLLEDSHIKLTFELISFSLVKFLQTLRVSLPETLTMAIPDGPLPDESA